MKGDKWENSNKVQKEKSEQTTFEKEKRIIKIIPIIN